MRIKWSEAGWEARRTLARVCEAPGFTVSPLADRAGAAGAGTPARAAALPEAVAREARSTRL